jgi:hypothetical protein
MPFAIASTSRKLIGMKSPRKKRKEAMVITKPAGMKLAEAKNRAVYESVSYPDEPGNFLPWREETRSVSYPVFTYC